MRYALRRRKERPGVVPGLLVRRCRIGQLCNYARLAVVVLGVGVGLGFLDLWQRFECAAIVLHPQVGVGPHGEVDVTVTGKPLSDGRVDSGPCESRYKRVSQTVEINAPLRRFRLDTGRSGRNSRMNQKEASPAHEIVYNANAS